ncbi:hypothetical protein HMPREF9099_00970 [Lachnospiraceae bacterium oral taxon 082 str. F0431]|nr:hypothetical protein HMPREF9099_00970 [Lachnospiraceae bacterium oral taxon 082 str. F0431]
MLKYTIIVFLLMSIYGKEKRTDFFLMLYWLFFQPNGNAHFFTL